MQKRSKNVSYFPQLVICVSTVADLVRPYYVPDAAHYAGLCMPGTRVQFLAHAKTVITTREGASIVWITGMAGTGKTCVASTLCQQLSVDSTVVLAGTFFCSRSASSIQQANIRRIVPTLATLLYRAIPACVGPLAAELRKEPELGSKSILVQVQCLLAKPLNTLEGLDRQIVFVIDALDQCSDHAELVQLINALADLKTPVPVKFVFTARPVATIRQSPVWDPNLPSFLQLSTTDPQSKADIHLFIQKTFENSPRRTSWFTPDDLNALATLADGLFVFAAATVNYILRKNPPQRLQQVKTKAAETSTLTNTLDQLYSSVLDEAMDPGVFEPCELEETRKIIASIVSSRAPLSIKTLADLLGLSSNQLRSALDELHSVVYVPEHDEEGHLRVLHPTFADFLFASAPDHLRIKQSDGHDALAQGCLDRLDAGDLRFNISGCETSFEPNPPLKDGRVASSLGYACVHWAHHVAQASRGFDDRIDSFLRGRLLFWLEVLSVIREVGIASELLRVALKVVRLHLSYSTPFLTPGSRLSRQLFPASYEMRYHL